MTNPFKKLVSDRPDSPQNIPQPKPETTNTTQESPPVKKVEQPPQSRKRGRPATGKRSDSDWIGRTYYVRRETDLDAEEIILKLKRQGIELDKSELVDGLLAAWVSWHKGGNATRLLGEISPRQKVEN
jgi:hypothetical protein